MESYLQPPAADKHISRTADEPSKSSVIASTATQSTRSLNAQNALSFGYTAAELCAIVENRDQKSVQDASGIDALAHALLSDITYGLPYAEHAQQSRSISIVSARISSIFRTPINAPPKTSVWKRISHALRFSRQPNEASPTLAVPGVAPQVTYFQLRRHQRFRERVCAFGCNELPPPTEVKFLELLWRA